MSKLFDLTFGNIPLLLFAITPVGVFNDLPESVTGMSKSKEWEIKEEQNEQ